MNDDKILKSPEKPIHLPAEIQWLSGEGCGSWFHIEKDEKLFKISRFSPEGKLECKGIFEQISGIPFDINSNYTFTYLSHCSLVNIIQKESNLNFKIIQKCNN